MPATCADTGFYSSVTESSLHQCIAGGVGDLDGGETEETEDELEQLEQEEEQQALASMQLCWEEGGGDGGGGVPLQGQVPTGSGSRVQINLGDGEEVAGIRDSAHECWGLGASGQRAGDGGAAAGLGGGANHQRLLQLRREADRWVCRRGCGVISCVLRAR